MSYYKLPKNSFDLNLKIECSSEEIKLYLSQSLHNYYNKLIMNVLNMNSQMDEFLQLYNINQDISLNTGNLLKFVHPCEYVFSIIPGLKQTVSKLTYKSNVFYELLEICNTVNFLDHYKSKNINSLHISNHSNETVECINMFINGTCLNNNIKNNTINSLDEIVNIYTNITLDKNSKKYDFIFCSVDMYDEIENINKKNNKFEIETTDNNYLNNYFLQLIQVVIIILKYQAQNGICVIKLDTTFHKPVVDILFMLTTLFDKTFIIKPSLSRITSFEKYVVCKNFTNTTFSTITTSVVTTVDMNKNNQLLGDLYNFYYDYKIQIINNNHKIQNIISILPNNLPYLFLNKIEDVNNILGQQQLEAIDQIGNLMKNRNKEDKLENMKKTNIQKSIHWCEKYKVPYNKFADKTNIFL
jgi:hypothetical protein